MPGLLRLAKDLVEQHPYLRVLSQKEIEAEDDGISEEERNRIAAQIQLVIDRNRITVDEETFRIRPRKHGGVFVLLVNLVALLVIAGSVYGALRYFDRQEETIVAPPRALVSAEGLLLETLQKEAEARLSEKDDEIRSIEGRLVEIDAERERLVNETEEMVAQREAAIREEFETLLESERNRLNATGLAEEDVEAEIARFRQEQESALARQLADVRAQADAAIADREAAIARLESEFEERLSAAEAERADLESNRVELEARYAAELAAGIENVRAEASAETAALEVQRAEALGELESLRTQREQEEFTVERLTALYGEVQDAIAADEFDAALGAIDGIGAFLSDPAVMALPAIRRRREIDLFLADTLEELVGMRRQGREQDTASLVQTAALVEAAATLITNADALLEDGDTAEAERLYRAAIGRIPATAVGLERLEELQAQAATSENAELEALVTSANTAYVGGEYETAAARYADVIAYLPVEDAALYARLLDTGYQLRAEALRVEQLAALQVVEAAASEEVAVSAARAAALEEERTAAAARIEELEAGIEELNAALEERSAELEAARQGGSATAGEIETLRRRLAEADAAAASSAQQAEASLDRAVAAETRIESAEQRVREAEAALAAAEAAEAATSSSGPSRYAEYVRQYRQRYEAGSGAGLEDSAGRRSAIELLETKLLLLRLANSPDVREEYPDLYEDTNKLFEDLVAVERADAEEQALAELVATLESILAERDATLAAGSGAIPEPGSANADELLRDIFAGLERLTTN